MSLSEYKSLKEHVYRYLAEKIDSGELHGGDRVPEQGVCDELGISRTPVREALIQLASDGYLESVPRKGFHVRSVSEQSAREIFEIMGPLDGRAALLACPNLNEADVTRLQFLQESMELAIRKQLLKTYNELQHDFHGVYIGKCGNQRLIYYITQLDRFFMGREYAGTSGEQTRELLERANGEHGEIARLLAEGDGEGAQRYIRDVHWDVANARFASW